VRTVDIRELSNTSWPLFYRLTYGDGWYRDKDGKQEAVFRPPTYAHEGAERAGGRNAVLDMPALARGHEPSTMGFSGGAAARTRRHG
jgi:hypothetical protein